jgi:hypothetical protein
MILKLIVFFGTLGITPIFGCDPVELDQLIRDPRSFEGRCVCVTGVTEGDGIKFALFRPPHPPKSHSVILVVNTREPRYNAVDGHWVQICGTVTMDDQQYFACKLILETANPLQKQPAPGLRVFGVFENDGRETLNVQIISNDGTEGTVMILRPGDITETVITAGKIKIFATSADFSRTKLLSEHVMPTVESTSNHFESSTRRFYFSLSARRMSLIKPANAQEMRKRWEAIEKNASGK